MEVAMLKYTMSIILFALLATGPASAQQCLHGPNETPDETSRRHQALTAARTVNTLQANQPGARNRSYLRHVDLDGSSYAQNLRQSTNETLKRISLRPEDEILPKWKLTLDVTESGYWFMIKDLADPCGFAYISNQTGLIFNSAPIQ
jgi:hypothetical protein